MNNTDYKQTVTRHIVARPVPAKRKRHWQRVGGINHWQFAGIGGSLYVTRKARPIWQTIGGTIMLAGGAALATIMLVAFGG